MTRPDITRPPWCESPDTCASWADCIASCPPRDAAAAIHVRIPWVGSGPNPHPGVTTVAMTPDHANAVRHAYGAMLADVIARDDPGWTRADARAVAIGMAYRFNRIDHT